MKKIIVTLLSSTAIGLFCNPSFADSTNCASVASIAALGVCVDSVYHAAKAWVNNQNYQNVPNASQITTTNTAQVSIQNASSSTLPGGFAAGTGAISLSPTLAAEYDAKQNTTNNLTNTLSQFNYGVYHDDSTLVKKFSTAEGQPFKDYMNNNSLAALTIGEKSKASDTLYIADERGKGTTAYSDNKDLLAKPNTTNDDYFNFSTLFTPIAYSEREQNAAQEYLKYAAQSTQSLINGVNLSKLYSNPRAMKTLKENPAYQQYVFTMRSLLALRSISVNLLNQLIAERTPMPGLAQAAGLPANSQAKASPLQVEAYQANHRVDNPQWYNTDVAQASPATVQRETLIVLAEIEHQNYQAHLDRERILAALTESDLQMNAEVMDGFMKQAQSKLNTAITDAESGAKPPKKPASPEAATQTTTATPGITTSTQ